VVIAIIGILVALLLPAIQAAREAARRSQCQNNLKQMTLATLNYEDSKKELPPIYVYVDDDPNKPKDGFHTFILPYLEYQGLYDQYDFEKRWSEEPNRTLALTNIPEFICPTAPAIGDRQGATGGGGIFGTATPPLGGYADYGINGRLSPQARCTLIATGVDDRPDWSGLFTGGKAFVSWGQDCPGDLPGSQKPIPKQTGKTYLRLATDGLSHTIFLSPDAGRPLNFEDGKLITGIAGGSQWADPANEWWSHDLCRGATSIMNCNNRDENYAFHVGGGMYSMGDGSVHFISDDVDLDLSISLTTRAGDDAIDGSF
jgi:type II secretory pathway pseudopilin PulG